MKKHIRNPHFDDGIIIWRDEYSGKYEPPPTGYSEQFDLQWKIALKDANYFNYAGASTDVDYIHDRVYEWTGKHPLDKSNFIHKSGGSRVLDYPLDPRIIKGKKCIDIGCGMGRWTRVMQFLDAREVLSIDISKSAIESVKKFNKNVLRTNIMEIPEKHPELIGKFDFATFWGVVMTTNDPKKTFKSAASTVKPGGYLYMMAYAPVGLHNKKITNLKRKIFYNLKTIEERLAFVDKLYSRKWNKSLPLFENILNIVRNVLKLPRSSKIAILDMLEPFYNWTISLSVIKNWMKEEGFIELKLLNKFEKHKCAYHVLGRKGFP